MAHECLASASLRKRPAYRRARAPARGSVLQKNSSPLERSTEINQPAGRSALTSSSEERPNKENAQAGNNDNYMQPNEACAQPGPPTSLEIRITDNKAVQRELQYHRGECQTRCH